MTENAYLYVLKFKDSARIKIGRTVNVEQRIAAFGGAKKFDLENSYLVSSSPRNIINLEKQLHQDFKPFKMDHTGLSSGNEEIFDAACKEVVIEEIMRKAERFPHLKLTTQHGISLKQKTPQNISSHNNAKLKNFYNEEKKVRIQLHNMQLDEVDKIVLEAVNKGEISNYNQYNFSLAGSEELANNMARAKIKIISKKIGGSERYDFFGDIFNSIHYVMDEYGEERITGSIGNNYVDYLIHKGKLPPEASLNLRNGISPIDFNKANLPAEIIINSGEQDILNARALSAPPKKWQDKTTQAPSTISLS